MVAKHEEKHDEIFRSNRGRTRARTIGHYESERLYPQAKFSLRLENNFPAYHRVMTQRLSTQRQEHITLRIAGKDFRYPPRLSVVLCGRTVGQPCRPVLLLRGLRSSKQTLNRSHPLRARPP